MANAKHNLVTITYTLDPAPVGNATLGVVLLLAEDLDLDNTGARTKTFASKTELDTAVTNSEMTAAQANLGKAAFDQLPRPDYIRYGNVDILGAETYADGYDAVKAETSDFFYVTAETRTPATQLVLASQLSSDLVLYIAQTSDAGALGNLAAKQAVYTNTTQENFVLIFHDDDLVGLDVGYAAARGTFDPDNRSVGWQGVVRGVDAYADGTIADSSTRDQALGVSDDYVACTNLMLSIGNQSNYVSRGRTWTGRQIKTMVSVFWYVIRLKEDLLDQKLTRDARGDLIPINEDGQAIMRAIIEARYNLGVAAQHFKAQQIILEFPDPIPSADIDAGVLQTSEHQITVLSNGEEFQVGVAFSSDDVVVEVTE